MVSFQAKAASFEKAEIKLRHNAIDPEQLSELLNKQVSDWRTLTPQEKEIFAKGMIIYLDMETSDNPSQFDQHAQASIHCMDTKGHGLKLPPSEDISLPLVRCTTDNYQHYRHNGNP